MQNILQKNNCAAEPSESLSENDSVNMILHPSGGDDPRSHGIYRIMFQTS